MASATSNAVIAAFTTEQANRLTGVTQRQLRFWANNLFFVPSLTIDEDDFSLTQLYSFRDLVCLKVINALRNEANIALKELWDVKERLAHLGEDMWAKTTLYILGKKGCIRQSGDPEKRRKDQADRVFCKSP